MQDFIVEGVSVGEDLAFSSQVPTLYPWAVKDGVGKAARLRGCEFEEGA